MLLKLTLLFALAIQPLLIDYSHTIRQSEEMHIPTNRIRAIIWFAHLAADWTTTVCIGVLSNNQGDYGDDLSQQTNTI